MCKYLFRNKNPVTILRLQRLTKSQYWAEGLVQHTESEADTQQLPLA
jgi:hypothetical protein